MNDVGIGIIGSGFMGRTYAETIAKYCKRAHLVGVTGGSRAKGLASDYSIALEPTVDALVRRDDVDAIFIATPHHTHAEQALAAAHAGKHLLIEKPMAASVAQCDAILDACKGANVQCSIAFSQRARKCNVQAKRLIDEGAIGRILHIEETCLIATGLAGMPKWQSDPENLGTLFGHAIHNFDRIRWFTNEEIKTVYAKCGSLEPDVQVEGSSMVLMTLTDGTVASLWSSFQVPTPSFPRSQFSARIIGEKGLIDLDAYGELRITKEGQWHVAERQAPIDWQGKGFLDPVRLESYSLQCQDFIDALTEGRSPQVVGWDGRQAVAAALAAYLSSDTANEVSL
ncbi:MAG: Gfo/Idh/MocA family protein [Pirellulales bacterium]